MGNAVPRAELGTPPASGLPSYSSEGAVQVRSLGKSTERTSDAPNSLRTVRGGGRHGAGVELGRGRAKGQS